MAVISFDETDSLICPAIDIAEHHTLMYLLTFEAVPTQQHEEFDESFDVATGRSVASLPQFCAWMQHLLSDDGHLLYWIGGEIPPSVLEKVEKDEPVGELLPQLRTSDKRILTFSARSVKAIAKESGLLRKLNGPTNAKKKKIQSKKSKVAKGAWNKEREAPKQRGYEDFKRYSFSPASSSPTSQEE